MSLARILGLLLCGTVAVASAVGVHAQVFAKHPLRIFVPVPAGGTSDIVARLLADHLRERLGRPVLVENKAGASGSIAVDALRTATPDGTTLLLAPILVPVIGPLMLKNLTYEPTRDLAPVAQVARYQFALAVAAHHPARDATEFVAWAKANRTQANFGTSAAGSLPHFLGVLLARAADIDLVHIAYKGVGQLEVELMSGQIAAGISALSDFLPLHRAGRLRILATSGAARSPLLPAVPTFREQGFSSVEAHGWHGMYAPAGTPQPVIEHTSAVIVALLQAPELRARFMALGLEPSGTTPQELAAIMAADTARWRPIIKAAGFTAE